MKLSTLFLASVLASTACAPLKECLEQKTHGLTYGCRHSDSEDGNYVRMALHLYDADSETLESAHHGNYDAAITFLESKTASDPLLATSLGLAYLEKARQQKAFPHDAPELCRQLFSLYETAEDYFILSAWQGQESWILDLIEEVQLQKRWYDRCPEQKLPQPPLNPAILKKKRLNL